MEAAEGKSRQLWDHTASIMAALAQVNGDNKTARDFHPYHQQTAKEPDIRCKDGNESMAVLSKWSGVKRTPQRG